MLTVTKYSKLKLCFWSQKFNKEIRGNSRKCISNRDGHSDSVYEETFGSAHVGIRIRILKLRNPNLSQPRIWQICQLYGEYSPNSPNILIFGLDHNDGQFFRAMEWLMFFFRPPLPSMVFQWFWQSWTITIECFLGGPTIGTNGFSMVFKILRAMVNNGFEVQMTV